MIVLAREVFLCKCPTAADALPRDGSPDGDARDLRFVRGDVSHLGLLDPAHHGDEHVRDFRDRLALGETWLLGLRAGRVATYTWLHDRDTCAYPYLPGCVFGLPPDTAYGYDAWTPPELRGGGLRRHAFVEELRLLADRGKKWEASFFVAHQLEGARRSLGLVGITIVPVWRAALGRDRRLSLTPLADPCGITPRVG
jgi:hypothetical protein